MRRPARPASLPSPTALPISVWMSRCRPALRAVVRLRFVLEPFRPGTEHTHGRCSHARAHPRWGARKSARRPRTGLRGAAPPSTRCPHQLYEKRSAAQSATSATSDASTPTSFSLRLSLLPLQSARSNTSVVCPTPLRSDDALSAAALNPTRDARRHPLGTWHGDGKREGDPLV